MLDQKKPIKQEPPDHFNISVKPADIVSAGDEVNIEITYATGNYYLHRPVLELLRAPNWCPEKPQEWGEIVSREGNSATFMFRAEKIGIYVLRLRPFEFIPTGQLI